MYSRANYMIVGLFVLLLGAGLIWFALWLGKYGAYREFDTYKVVTSESVSGLSKDSVVKLHGVDIGRVGEIRIDPKDVGRIEILLKIRRGVPIKEDMVAFVQITGLTGLKSIEIDGGTNRAVTLQPTEEFVPVIPTAPSWMSVAQKGIGNLSEKITSLVGQSQKLLSDSNIEKFNKMLENLERITSHGEALEIKTMGALDEVNATVAAFRSSMEILTTEFQRLSVDVSEGMKHANSSLESIKDEGKPVLAKLMKTVKNFNRVTLRVERTLRRGDYNLKKIFEPVLVDIEIMGNQISELTRQIQRSPNDMIFKSRKSRRGPGE